jgi:hypothetical protein
MRQLADPKVKARLADLGGTVLALSPADFNKLIADETEKCASNDELAQVGLAPPTGTLRTSAPSSSRRSNTRCALDWAGRVPSVLGPMSIILPMVRVSGPPGLYIGPLSWRFISDMCDEDHIGS